MDGAIAQSHGEHWPDFDLLLNAVDGLFSERSHVQFSSVLVAMPPVGHKPPRTRPLVRGFKGQPAEAESNLKFRRAALDLTTCLTSWCFHIFRPLLLVIYIHAANDEIQLGDESAVPFWSALGRAICGIWGGLAPTKPLVLDSDFKFNVCIMNRRRLWIFSSAKMVGHSNRLLSTKHVM